MRLFAVLCVRPTLNAFLPMLKYFLLLIAAFAVALAVGPYIRGEVLNSYAFYASRWQALLKKWSLGLGRYFMNRYRNLERKSKLVEEKRTPDEGQKTQEIKAALGKLTPIHNAENIALYEAELSDKLNDPDVKNIAITGPYGSGKSSIIKTFFHKHAEYRPLYVSLAAFKDDRKINGKEESTANWEATDGISPEQQKVLDDRIEYSILQQLFYHVKGRDVPFSRLKRIRTVKPSKIIRLALLVALFALCALYVYVPSWLPGYKIWKAMVPDGGWLYYMAILGIVIGSIYIVYLLFKFQQNASVIKLNLDKAQLEIAPDKGSSVLNQHMDEIVYYFSATNHDLLVIEDLDRFKNSEIFVKLREINTLINNSLQINRKVTFIYALRDDVFVDQNRTKFFDFILPVVPVTNASNSASNLINKFDSLRLPKPVSHDFLNDLSLFITDRRLIQNIFNEFQVYRHQLNIEDLQADMLLAMIVYKNIHPTDFNDLQSNKGMVYEFFQQKGKINAEMAEDTEAKLNDLENKLREVEATHLKSVHEFKLLYMAGLLLAIYKKMGEEFVGKIWIADKLYSPIDILDDNVFYRLRTEGHLWVKTKDGGKKSSEVHYTDIEKEIGLTESLEARVKKIQAISEVDVLQLKREINTTRDEIRQIRGQSVKELLARRKLSSFVTPLNQHKALAYLVSNGYISEDYWLYVSYFEPGQLSDMDHKFILAVKNRTETTPDHKLTSVGQVILRLNDSDFQHKEALNYDLLNMLLRLKNVHPGKLAGIVGQLGKLSSDERAFIEKFALEYKEPGKVLIGEIIKVASGFWVVVNKRMYYDLEYYLRAIVEYGELESVVALNEGNILSDDIEQTAVFIEGNFDRSYEKVTQLIKRLNIKFKIATERVSTGNQRVLKYVYDNHHYALTREMVDFMLKYRLAVQDIDEYNSGQLTRILAVPHEPIAVYVQANLETYLKDVFIQLPANNYETQETISFLLKNKKLSDATKMVVIEKASFLVEDLQKMPMAYLEPLFINRRFKATWGNIYWFRLNNRGSGFSNEFVEFLKRDGAVKELSMDNMDKESQHESHRSQLIELLENKNLDIDSKISLLNATKVALKINSFERIEVSVIEEMEKRGLIQQDANTFKILMKAHLPTFVKQFSKHVDIDSAPALLKTIEMDYKAYYQLLQTINLRAGMREVLYASMNEYIKVALLLKDYNIPVKVLEPFKISTAKLHKLAGKIPYTRSVEGLLKANKEYLAGRDYKKFSVTDRLFMKISNR